MREVRNPRVAAGLLPPSRKGEAAGMSRYRGDATAVQFPVHIHPRGGTRDLGGDWDECVRTPVSIHARHPSISHHALCQEPGCWMPIPAALRDAPDTASAPG